MKVIGTKNCSRCKITTSILDKNNIDYDYFLFDDMSSNEQELYLNVAKESGLGNFPIIVNDNEEAVELGDVL